MRLINSRRARLRSRLTRLYSTVPTAVGSGGRGGVEWNVGVESAHDWHGAARASVGVRACSLRHGCLSRWAWSIQPYQRTFAVQQQRFWGVQLQVAAHRHPFPTYRQACQQFVLAAASAAGVATTTTTATTTTIVAIAIVAAATVIIAVATINDNVCTQPPGSCKNRVCQGSAFCTVFVKQLKNKRASAHTLYSINQRQSGLVCFYSLGYLSCTRCGYSVWLDRCARILTADGEVDQR